jgi:hypothetical protein
MFDFKKYFSTKATSQSHPIPGTNQVPNSAGGFTWQLDDWARLDRFLVLGCEGGTYYVGERELRSKTQPTSRGVSPQTDLVPSLGSLTSLKRDARPRTIRRSFPSRCARSSATSPRDARRMRHSPRCAASEPT